MRTDAGRPRAAVGRDPESAARQRPKLLVRNLTIKGVAPQLPWPLWVGRQGARTRAAGGTAEWSRRMLHPTPNTNPILPSRRKPVVVLLATLALLLGCAASPALSSARASALAVSAFPSPGTQYAEPGTQIAFRGISPSAIGPVTVVG